MDRRSDDAREGKCCCKWRDFADSYTAYRGRWFDSPPTPNAIRMATRDWKSGNTGWEAAHNEQRRAKERELKSAVSPIYFEPPIDPERMANALISRARHAAPGKDAP